MTTLETSVYSNFRKIKIIQENLKVTELVNATKVKETEIIHGVIHTRYKSM